MKDMFRRLKRVYGAILSMAWSAASGRATGLFASVVFLGIAGAASGFLTKLVIDALSNGPRSKAITMSVLFVIVTGGTSLVQSLFQLLQFDMGDRITQELDKRLMQISASVPGLDHLERPEFADKLKLVRERTYIPNQALLNINQVAYIIIGLVAGMVLLGLIHPILALLPFVAVPSAYLQFRSAKKHLEGHDKTAPEVRLANHYVELGTGIKAAKETRLFGLGNYLVDEHKKLMDGYISKHFKDRVKRSGIGTVSGLVYGSTLAGSIAFIGWLALRGRASIGDVAMGVMVARMAIGRVEAAAEVIAWTAELSFIGERYLWLLEYQSDVVVKVASEALPAPTSIVNGITLHEVGLTYPGTEKPVLEEISLFIPAGSTIALVGENGAGKTSLVKLLCRFYDPTEGHISVDGIDLKEIDLHQWRSRAAVSFQDFVKYQFVAREAIGVGDLEHIGDGARIAAAARQAGATAVINRLPDGVDTQLGRDFQGGIELSEGEWQRVALARGSMRTTPAVLILDEPTASLDAQAEHEVFERFSLMAKPEDGPPPISILVSHRFSTVRMADLIVVLHKGRIAELGSHEALMAQGGRYAELFTLQASRYD